MTDSIQRESHGDEQSSGATNDGVVPVDRASGFRPTTFSPSQPSQTSDGKSATDSRSARPVTARSTLTLDKAEIPAHLLRFFRPRSVTKPKDDLMIPHRVYQALMQDGWYGRMDCVWSKPNPMPESVTDRPTKAHEYVFLLSKRPRYFYDADAIREDSDPAQEAHNQRYAREYDAQVIAGSNGRKPPGNLGSSTSGSLGIHARPGPGGRNKRSVWTVATQPYAGAHFATFPPKLIEPCILAGCPERACGECGAPWVRVVERTTASPGQRVGYNADCGARNDGVRAGSWTDMESRTLGFEPSCPHGDGSASGVVLDPFAGAGTTGVVALKHRREFVGMELNSEYAQMARERIEESLDPYGYFMRHVGQGDLFGGGVA